MILKKVDVIIFFEHVSRELDSLAILKVELESLGISSVILPIHYNRYVNVLRFKPKLIILPYLYSECNPTRRLFESTFPEVKILNLHHEQFYNEGTKEHLIPSDRYSKEVHHLSWSKKFKIDLMEVGVKCENISVLGNPRTDSFYYSNNLDIKELVKDYEKLIFVVTTFSWALVDESYFLKINSIDEKEFRKRKKITYDAAVKYFEDFAYLADKYPNYIFVIRPHPFEDIDIFTKLFLESSGLNSVPQNIKIIRDYNVYDWLKYANLTIGWCTTVNMEAQLFDCKNIIYHPTYYPKEMNLEFFEYYNIVKERPDLEEVILGNDSITIQDKHKEYIENNFGKVDGKVNYRIALKVQELLLGKEKIVIDKSGFLKNILRAASIDLTKNVLFKLNLLHKYDPSFSGILVDNPSLNYIEEVVNEKRNH